MDVEINIRAIVDRIKREEGLSGDEDVATLLGIEASALSHRIKKNSMKLVEYLNYCYTRNKPIEWVLYGAKRKESESEEYGSSNIVSIKVFTMQKSQEKGKSGILVPVEEIGIPVGDFNRHLMAYRHSGHEMGEVIPDGSIVLVNLNETTPIPGEIYLIKYWYAGTGEHKKYIYVVRRLEMKSDGAGLVLKPESPNCDSIELPAEKIEEDTIIGRITNFNGRRYLYKDMVA